jgi:hypothetical protein
MDLSVTFLFTVYLYDFLRLAISVTLVNYVISTSLPIYTNMKKILIVSFYMREQKTVMDTETEH